MKVFYHGGNKNPFIFEMSTNEVSTIIYHTHESIDRLKESIEFGERMVKSGKKEFKGFLAEKKRNLKALEKIANDYESFRLKFTNQTNL